MEYIKYDFNLGSNNVVSVSLNKQANVKLMDDANYNRYRRGEKHSYYGGCATKSPVNLRPPHPGHWYIIVDLGGYSGSVNASVSVM